MKRSRVAEHFLARTEARNDGSLDQVHSYGAKMQKRSDSGYIVRLQLTGSPDLVPMFLFTTITELTSSCVSVSSVIFTLK